MDAILKVCDDYEEVKIFYSKADANQWAEYSEKVMTASNTKKHVRTYDNKLVAAIEGLVLRRLPTTMLASGSRTQG